VFLRLGCWTFSVYLVCSLELSYLQLKIYRFAKCSFPSDTSDETHANFYHYTRRHPDTMLYCSAVGKLRACGQQSAARPNDSRTKRSKDTTTPKKQTALIKLAIHTKRTKKTVDLASPVHHGEAGPFDRSSSRLSSSNTRVFRSHAMDLMRPSRNATFAQSAMTGLSQRVCFDNWYAARM